MHKYIMFAKDKIDEKNINIFDCLKEIKYIILLKKIKEVFANMHIYAKLMKSKFVEEICHILIIMQK